MINIDGSLVIQMINFLLLVWALNVILYRPIRGIVARRREKMLSLESGIGQYEQDARNRDAAFNDGIRAAREKGFAEKALMEQQAREEEMKLIEEINEKAREDALATRQMIAKEAETVRISLQTQIGVFADDISSKLLGRAV
ncbi:MAG: ATP synthase F0 subunit B [Deltaproteobacteria bacterium]|nr:ATP synthase F0 subunit B [Deltaproteobacteria bacterium]